MYLTESNPKLERHHGWIREAAATCLANKEDKAACERAIKEARDKVQSTVTLPIDNTSLEGLEEYMTEQKLPELGTIENQPEPVETVKANVAPGGFLAKAKKTDDELYEECEECHVAVAAARFADICAEKHDEAGGCELIGKSLENENTEPVDWIKAMVQTAEKATGTAKEEMVAAVSELTDYLEKRSSPLLKALDKEEKHG